MNKSRQVVPIYTTKGDAEAFLVYPFIFNVMGEWIGWMDENKKIFSVRGQYIGWLGNGPRILRKRVADFNQPSRTPPPRPRREKPIGSTPLAPLMAELAYETIDVLLDYPELLYTYDSGEGVDDMD